MIAALNQHGVNMSEYNMQCVHQAVGNSTMDTSM